MVKCSKCQQEKEESEFYYRKTENRYQSYCKKCLHESQSQRWIERKIKAIDLFGGCCSQCGYNKNYAALDFHHCDPSKKEADWGRLRLRSWDKIIKELKKCILVCRNCHAELHNPQGLINKNYKISSNLNITPIKPTGICPECKSEIYGTKYCSEKCVQLSRRKVKRPNNKILSDDIKKLGYCGTGRKYGVSDNCIRKWEQQNDKELSILLDK